jgi:hypothetical protein
MKITKRRLRLAWKYRGLLWRYRGLIRNRRPIGVALAAAGAMLAAGALAKRAQRA